MVTVRVLGPLSAEVDGRPVELPADARARELLAWLAVSPGSHSRSALAGRLRPDVPEDSARKTLRDALYELRRTLGPDVLVATRETVGLADVARVDLRELEALRAAGQLEAAAELGCAGELLAGMDADWILRARDEHAAALAGALAELTAAARDPRAALAWARRRVVAEPLAEDAHRELIRRLAETGDRPAALAHAATLAERLRRELGVAPAPETRALVEDVRRGRLRPVAASAAQPSLPPPLARTARPEGREPALARLASTLRDARAGGLRIALVAGEPGIGKTTLSGELARRAHADGAAVLYGRSDDRSPMPYQPWVEALERWLAEAPAPERGHWLAANDGALARLLPAHSPGAAVTAGPRERHLAFETARELLEHAAAERPWLLVLDDAHWADADSLALLRHLARTAHDARALIVLCVRDAELPQAVATTIADLRREGPLLSVPLAGLDEAAVAAVIARHDRPADAGAVRRYRDRTGGNPFFLDELLREADHEGTPPGVREVVGRRLERLAHTTRGVLAAAAVLGLEFARDDVGGDPATLLDALDEAAAAGLVTPLGDARYAFPHALVRETIVAGLPAGERASEHLRAAERLAGPGRAAEVAAHLRAAGPLAATEERARWELAAAREARAALAHAEAAGHYEAVIDLAGRTPELLLALGHARERAGRRDEARAAFAEAAERAGGPEELAEAALGHGGLGVFLGPPEPQTIALLERAIATGADPARLRARLAVELYYADPSRAEELSAEAVALARRPEERAAALNARRVALWAPAHTHERLAVVDEMVAAAEAAGDREALLQARNWRVIDLWELGRMRELDAEIDAYAALAGEVGLPHYRWYVPLWRAGLAIMAGRWEEADALAGRALALGLQADDPNAPLLVDVQRAHAEEMRHLDAPGHRQRLLDGAARAPSPGVWLSAVAMLDATAGREESARRRIAELTRDGCAALPMNVNWFGACELSEAIALLGDRDAAAALYPRLEPHAGLFALIARGVGCYGVADHALGRLAATLGRLDEAAERFRHAFEACERTGAAPRSALALASLGETLRARGEHEAAAGVLADAAGRAHALGMDALAACALSNR